MHSIQYSTSRYFVGMKVEVGIPLPDNRIFRDWAVINEIDADLVSLQLSRDILPDGVSLRVGQALTMRGERDGQTYTCRCFIVSMGYDNDLLLRLTGEIFSGEMREFYRVDAFLPVKYQSAPDQSLSAAKSLWEARLKWRQNEQRAWEQRRLAARRERQMHVERLKELKLLETMPWEILNAWQEQLQDELYDEQVAFAESLAVTIGGGGLKIQTSRAFSMDELLLLEIFVPSTRLIVDIVARVVFVGRDEMAGPSCFSTGMRFIFIEESSRSAINSHISSLQLRRIRHFRGFADVEPLYGHEIPVPEKHYALMAGVGVEGSAGSDSDRMDKALIFRQVGLGLFFVCVMVLTGYCFSEYRSRHPKNDIQQIFEKGISQRNTVAVPARGLSGG